MSPPPWMREIEPGGKPASWQASTRAAPVSGVRSEGLRMTALPPPRPGARSSAGMFIGKFHGVMQA